MSTNQEIINNLETLLAAVEAQPESQFNLSHFKVEEPCGSLFCTVGLACTMPEFKAMGYELVPTGGNWNGSPTYRAHVNHEDVVESDVCDPAFGDEAYQRLFRPAGGGWIDDDLGYDIDYSENTATMTDKELAIARLNHQIAAYKGEAA